MAIDLNCRLLRFDLARQWMSRSLAQAISVKDVVHTHVRRELKLVRVSSYPYDRIGSVYLLVKLLARATSSKSFRCNVHFISYSEVRLSTLLVSLTCLTFLSLSNPLLSYLSCEFNSVITSFSVFLSLLISYLLLDY